ncbi:MAG TPA: hypothetical protein VGA70_11295, partial [Longimicrobiales bacterium]
PLRADVVSGAAVVARTACEVVRRASTEIPADSPEALRAGLGQMAVAILDAQPAMASLVALAARVLDAVEGASSVEAAREAAATAARAFDASLQAMTDALVGRAADELPRGGTILTTSSSSTVRAVLLECAPARGLSVICLESRPMNEGRFLAAALARGGIPVTFAVDAAAVALLREADACLLGADSIGDRGVVNKIGSCGVARSARSAGLPVLVAADASKLLPRGFPQPVEDDRPPEEVWKAPLGARVWNRYFEAVPMSDVTRVITDTGVYSPEEIGRLRDSLAVPVELRRWADGRGPAGPGLPEEPGHPSGV